MTNDAVLDNRTLAVTPQPTGFGAEIRGVDLSKPLAPSVLDDETVAALSRLNLRRVLPWRARRMAAQFCQP